MGKKNKMQSAYLKVQGLNIFTRYAEDGKNNSELPVIFIHGLAVSGRYVIPLAKVLKENRNIYFPDLPGFGKSSKPDKVYNIEELAHFVVEWMAAAGIKKAVFMANSLGCQIITYIGHLYPEKCDRLILVSPTMDPNCRSGFMQALRLARNQFHEPVSINFVILRDFLDCGPRRTLITLKYGLADQQEARLSKIKIPVLVMKAGKDPIVPESWAKLAVDLLPDAYYVLIKDKGHVLHYNSPELVCQLVIDFSDSNKVFPRTKVL